MPTDLLSSPLIPLLVVTHTAAFCAGAILEYVTERELDDRRGARVDARRRSSR